MSFENILAIIESGVLTLTINRPKKLNALNKATLEELHLALANAKVNEDVKVIIITGSETKAFVAGADISEFADFSVEQGALLSKEGQDKVFTYIENMNKPVIAAVNGFALGGGLELAMAAHIRVASDNAKMGLPEVSLGVIPGYGGTQRLVQLVGKGLANEIIFTAGMLNAEQALNAGLVNHVVTQEELLPKVHEIAKKIMRNSPKAIAYAIDSVNAQFIDGVDGLQREVENFGACFGTADFKEGTTAFLEKRKPVFSGK